MTDPPADTLLLRPREAARLLAISERTLWTLTHERGEIRCIRLHRAVLYPRAELVRWINSKMGEADGLDK